MKVLQYLLGMVMMSLVLQGCSTSEKFTIRSSQDATLFLPTNPNGKYATTGADYLTKIEVPSNMYLGYTLLKDEQTGLKVPYGVNTHSSTRMGKYTGKNTGYALTAAGTMTGIIGTIILCVDSEEPIGPILCGAGFGAAGLGAALGAPLDSQCDQLAFRYSFAYDNKQYADISGLSATLLHPDAPKNNPPSVNDSPKRKKATSGESFTSQDNKGSTAKKTIAGISQKVLGTYVGNGSLSQKGILEEKYSNIKLIIEKVDKTHVKVTVIEDDEEFFEQPMIYEVKQDGKGYKLIMKNLPQATILISTKGTASYSHKKVNISDDIFTLDIKAVKE